MALLARKNYVDIKIEKYSTTFFYEKMKILPDDFKNEVTIPFFTNIIDGKPIQEKVLEIKDGEELNIAKQITNKINKLKTEAYDALNPNPSIKIDAKTSYSKKFDIGTNCIKIIFNYIFKYNIQTLWYTNHNTVFLFPTISTSNDHGLKLLLSNQKLYGPILSKNGDSIYSDGIDCSGGGGIKPDNEKMGKGNVLEYLNIISEDDEDIETFKERIKNNLDSIKEKIKSREIGDGGSTNKCNQYHKIIYFVNKINGEEDPIFFKYYKKGLKKDFTSALKEQINKFINSGKIGQQPLRYNNSLPDANNIEKIDKNYIVRELKKTEYGYDQNSVNPHIDNIQLLLEKFKMFYKRETDENYKKSITTSDNSDIFNIFMRFNNLDTPVITDEIIANRDSLYEFYEKGKTDPKIGFFYVSNLERRQYIFNLDLIENKKYKDLKKSTSELEKEKEKEEETKKKSANNEDNESEEKKENREAKELEEQLIINPTMEIKDSTRKTLIEVKLEFGKTIFRNIQKDIKAKYEPENIIKYYGQRKGYDYYRWFNHRMIDTSLTDNINIRFFKDTIYDVKSFKAYLESEKKLSKDTRISLEFLKINASPEISKYNDFIFNNFKGNINPNLYLLEKDNYVFEEKIKKGIVDIIFERNSLVYIKETKQVSEKEKEGATPQNYKIIKYNYVPIFGERKEKELTIYNHFQKKVTTTVNETEINYYKNIKTGLKPITGDANKKIPSELELQLVNKKKTLGILVVDVSKDVFSNPVSLYLAAECKTRTKRLKDKFYEFKKYFTGGTNKKKHKISKKNKNKYTNRFKSKNKTKSRSKLRRRI
jgi:hypothetical protein